MRLTTLKIPGDDAIRLLTEHRARFAATGQYPFLIGDEEELASVEEAMTFNDQTPDAIIENSFAVKTAEWIAGRQKAAAEYGFSSEATLGEWPDENCEKGSVGLHKDVLSGAIKPDVYLGFAKIDKPWHLPAILKYGAWNDCPAPEVHCAFHRDWQERFGAEISGMSGAVIECAVRNPPTHRKAATILAWEHYWYCADIVEQGCESIRNLAAILMDSPYWYFWWD